MKYFIDLAYLLALIAVSPRIIYRILRHKRYKDGWGQRLGNIHRKHPKKNCIWLHAVSVGEANAAKTIITKLTQTLPDYEIVVSATTDTGYSRAKTLYSDTCTVIYFPFDISCIMQKAFKNIRPALCILMELEIWPNFASIAKSKNIPVIIANGRISDNSFPKYKLIKPLIKKTFDSVKLFLAQSKQYAERFAYLSDNPNAVLIAGNLKYDTAEITDFITGQNTIKQQFQIGDEKLFVAGGTGPGEEKIILEVYKKLIALAELSDLRLAIAPRKPERFAEIAALIENASFALTRLSDYKQNPELKLEDKKAVILIDTIGDLRKFYSLSDIVFAGRSLVPMGGSDMMESAALGKCTIVGNYTFNFRQTVDDLKKHNAIVIVNDGSELFEAIKKHLTNERLLRTVGSNAAEAIKNHQGATAKTIEQIKKLLTQLNLAD